MQADIYNRILKTLNDVPLMGFDSLKGELNIRAEALMGHVMYLHHNEFIHKDAEGHCWILDKGRQSLEITALKAKNAELETENARLQARIDAIDAIQKRVSKSYTDDDYVDGIAEIGDILSEPVTK